MTGRGAALPLVGSLRRGGARRGLTAATGQWSGDSPNKGRAAANRRPRRCRKAEGGGGKWRPARKRSGAARAGSGARAGGGWAGAAFEHVVRERDGVEDSLGTPGTPPHIHPRDSPDGPQSAGGRRENRDRRESSSVPPARPREWPSGLPVSALRRHRGPRQLPGCPTPPPRRPPGRAPSVLRRASLGPFSPPGARLGAQSHRPGEALCVFCCNSWLPRRRNPVFRRFRAALCAERRDGQSDAGERRGAPYEGGSARGRVAACECAGLSIRFQSAQTFCFRLMRRDAAQRGACSCCLSSERSEKAASVSCFNARPKLRQQRLGADSAEESGRPEHRLFLSGRITGGARASACALSVGPSHNVAPAEGG
ncbi:uncharacterized protein LOC128903308 isoform X2 [Rissa tridactyla]|uniref:uncharacterized protein LOC128903308 isoform X2 n=1 Tax=Rissa tridactyla TaxID=75485 RepID=UPI0023BAB9B2|nr:uncharacterized protein LOC128903308 isoform X2 [Rissa tridactyla]